MTQPQFSRRCLVSVTLMALAAGPALAQSAAYPNKPLKSVVPSPPGGSTDQLARLVGQRLQEA